MYIESFTFLVGLNSASNKWITPAGKGSDSGHQPEMKISGFFVYRATNKYRKRTGWRRKDCFNTNPVDPTRPLRMDAKSWQWPQILLNGHVPCDPAGPWHAGAPTFPPQLERPKKARDALHAPRPQEERLHHEDLANLAHEDLESPEASSGQRPVS